MSKPGPRDPAAARNGVDLSDVMLRRKLEADADRLSQQWTAVATAAAERDLAPGTVLLTARFEVLVGILADALGLPADEVMLQVESAAMHRAITVVEKRIADHEHAAQLEPFPRAES